MAMGDFTTGFDQLAMGHGEDAVGAGSKARIVGDEDDGGTLLAGHVEHQLDDAGAGLLVEVAGGLIGEEEFWLRNHGPSQADALLLATGKSGRAVVQAVTEADGGQGLGGDLAGFGERFAGRGDLEREANIVEGRQRRDQVEALKDDTEGLAAKDRKFVFTEASQVLPTDDDLAGGGALEPGQQHEERGLAAAGRTDDCGDLPRGDLERYFAENLQRRPGDVQRVVSIGHRYQRRGYAPVTCRFG